MANKEDFLDALSEYSKSPSRDISPVLEQYLNGVAKNGETLFQWQLLKPLIVGKMEQVIEELRQRQSSENIPDRPNVENVRFDVMRSRIMDALHKFNGAPFTIQRLCELLVDPKKHYKRSDKFLRGLEKNVLVVSTVDPYGRKVVSESGSKHLVNGIDSNGSSLFPRDTNITSSLPPVPAWVTTTSAITTLPQNMPTSESDQKSSKEHSPSVGNVGVSGSGVSSVCANQGDQPPAVHDEEVVEETVVAMDTNEADTVATGGGEALAEKDDEEEEMVVHTNALSSSSSPEELLASDSNVSPGAPIEISTTVTSSTKTYTVTNPWTSGAGGNISRIETSCSSSDQHTKMDCANSPEKTSASAVSQETSEHHIDSPSSTETQSSHTEHSETDPPIEFAIESSPEQSPDISSQSLNVSTSLDPSLASDTTKTTSNKDLDLEYNDSMVSSDIHLHSSNTGSNVVIPPLAASVSNVEIPTMTASVSNVVIPPIVASVDIASDVHPTPQEPSSSIMGAMASSSSDLNLEKDIILNSAEVCDSADGLERVVDSMEPPLSLVQFSVLPTVKSKTTGHPESLPFSSSSDCSDCEEPQAKYCRISDEASNPSAPTTVSTSSMKSASSKSEATSSNYVLAESSVRTNTTSDAICQDPPASLACKSESINVQTENQMESEMPFSEINVECPHEKAPSPPPPKLLSSGDSQGLNTEETLREEPQSEVTEIPDHEHLQEPMDQE